MRKKVVLRNLDSHATADYNESFYMEPSLQAEEPPLTAGGVVETLGKLREAIWRRRPILGEILQKHGEKSLSRYAQDFFDVNPLPDSITSRRPELIAVVEEQVAAKLGKERGAAVAKQLSEFQLVSTADHHAIIDNPYWVNANIITALPCVHHQEDKMPTIVVFSFASVSLNNASGFPRGIEFHGGLGGQGPIVRLPILPDKLKMGTVYGMRGYTKEDIGNALRLLKEREKAGDVVPEKAAMVRELLEGPLSADDVFAQPDLCSQITLINHRLWPQLFHAPGSKDAAPDMPALLYLDIETLVTELLHRHHLHNPKSLVHRALFDSTFLQPILDGFNGIPGAFCLDDGSGTFFFWAVDDKFHRVRLSLKDGALRSSHGTVNIPMNPEAVAQALRDKKIFPSTALCYLMVALYYGFKCLGGFCQVHDLTVLKQAWQKILETVGEGEEAKAIEPLQTKEMNAGGMMLTFWRTSPEHLTIPTGIDMLVERSMDTRPELYAKLADDISLDVSMQPMLPGAYTVFYSLSEREIDTSALTFENVLHSTGLYKKYIV